MAATGSEVLTSIVIHPITLGILALVFAVMVYGKHLKRKDSQLLGVVSAINKDGGYNFPDTPGRMESTSVALHNIEGGNLMFDLNAKKVAVIRSADDITVHDLAYIKTWRCVSSGRSNYGNAIEFSFADMEKPRLTVSVPDKKRMLDWDARLHAILR